MISIIRFSALYKNLLKLLGIAFFILFICEVTLILLEYPSNSTGITIFKSSKIRDPLLGWKNPSGAFLFNDPLSGTIKKVTYWPDQSRATRLDFEHDGEPLVFIGCSFVEGAGLDDEDTFTWKIQELFPNISVKNLGTAGYGTFQSLLALKEYFAIRSNKQTATIVYGFADFHLMRNIKNSLTQRYWLEEGNFPFCDLEGCSYWSGKSMQGILHHFRFFSLLENVWDSYQLSTKEEEAMQVTFRLIKEISEVAINNNSRLIIAPVSALGEKWDNFLRKAEVEVINCDNPSMHSIEYRLPDLHPNQLWSDAFANCLKNKIYKIGGY